MRKLFIAVSAPLLIMPPLLFGLYLFHVDVIGFVKRGLLLGIVFSVPLLYIAVTLVAAFAVRTIIVKILRAR